MRESYHGVDQGPNEHDPDGHSGLRGPDPLWGCIEGLLPDWRLVRVCKRSTTMGLSQRVCSGGQPLQGAETQTGAQGSRHYERKDGFSLSGGMTVIEEREVTTKEKWGRGKISRGERELFDMGFSWGLSREATPASCRRPWDDVGDKGEGEGEGNRGGRGGRGTEEDKRREENILI